jgi:hypothetical protein
MSAPVVPLTFSEIIHSVLVALEGGDPDDRKAALSVLRLIARHADVAIGAGRKVVDSWESGDLAGAVRELDAALDAALFDA